MDFFAFSMRKTLKNENARYHGYEIFTRFERSCSQRLESIRECGVEINIQLAVE